MNRKMIRVETIEIPLAPTLDALALNAKLEVVKKNSRSQKYNFISSLLPAYYFSRVIGLVPFSIVRDSNGEAHKARVNAFDLFWFIISIVMYLFLAFTRYFYIQIPQDGQDGSKSYILVIGESLLLKFGMIYGALMIIMDMLNRNRLVNILKKFTIFDKEVTNLSFNLDYKTRYRRCLGWYVLTAALSLLLALSTFIIYREDIPSKSTFYLFVCFGTDMCHRLVTATVLTTFFILIFNLHYRFQVLNILLQQQFIRRNGVRLSINLRKNESIAFIKFMGRLHDLLTGIMENINYCYSLQVMINIGATFVYSVFTFYTFYRYILQKSTFYEQRTRQHFDYQIFYTIYMSMVVYAGSIVAREGKKTSEILHNIVNRCKDDDVTTSLIQMSQQILHRHPIATCGLFKFDWTLLYTMIGAITTYLTILVQFDTPYVMRNKNFNNATLH